MTPATADEGVNFSPVTKTSTEYSYACKYCFTALSKFGKESILLGGARHLGDNIANQYFPTITFKHPTRTSGSWTVWACCKTSGVANYAIDAFAALDQVHSNVEENKVHYYAVASPRDINFNLLKFTDTNALMIIDLNPDETNGLCKLKVIMKRLDNVGSLYYIINSESFKFKIYPRSF